MPRSRFTSYLLLVLLAGYNSSSSAVAQEQAKYLAQSDISVVDRRLSDLERKTFGTTYESEFASDRIVRLETKAFGKKGVGSLSERLDRLDAFGKVLTLPTKKDWADDPDESGPTRDRAGLSTVRKNLQSAWTPPADSLRLVCIVAFTTDSTDADSVKTWRSSGNPAFDEKAKRIVKSMLPISVTGRNDASLNARFDGASSSVDVYVEPKPDLEPYMAQLNRGIKEHWNPPKGNESKRVEVVFKLMRDGQIKNPRIQTSAGMQAADDAALDAINKFGKAPPLPEDCPDQFDIQFTFDYNVFKDSEMVKNAGENATQPGQQRTADREKAVLLNNLGVTALAASEFDLALTKLEAALLADPSYNRARENLSIAYNNTALSFSKTNPQKSLRYFHRALRLDPSNATTRSNLDGIIKLLGKDPQSFTVRVELGNAAKLAGDNTSAIVEYQAALGIQKSAEVQSKLDQALLASKSDADASIFNFVQSSRPKVDSKSDSLASPPRSKFEVTQEDVSLLREALKSAKHP